MKKTIKVTVSPDGRVSIEALGYAGAACELDTKELETALGVASSRTIKPERYNASSERRGLTWQEWQDFNIAKAKK